MNLAEFFIMLGSDLEMLAAFKENPADFVQNADLSVEDKMLLARASNSVTLDEAMADHKGRVTPLSTIHSISITDVTGMEGTADLHFDKQARACVHFGVPTVGNYYVYFTGEIKKDRDGQGYMYLCGSLGGPDPMRCDDPPPPNCLEGD